MPLFSIIKKDLFFSPNGVPDISPILDIQLDNHESISDDLLSNIDKSFTHISFGFKTFERNQLLKITCSETELGRINPKSLLFYGKVETIDDGIFANCSNLQNLYIGGSNQSILDSAPNLLKQPLKYLVLNGYGMVIQGKDLQEITKKTKCILK